MCERKPAVRLGPLVRVIGARTYRNTWHYWLLACGHETVRQGEPRVAQRVRCHECGTTQQRKRGVSNG